MAVRIPPAPNTYSQRNESDARTTIQKALDNARQADQDLEVRRDQRLYMYSPDGQRWQVSVSNLGVITAVLA